MRRLDFGKGTLKAIFTLAFLAGLAYSAFQILPVYIHNYDLQNYIRDLAVRASVNRVPAEAIRKDVVDHARDLDLPIGPGDVKVSAGNKVTIELDYSVPVDLKVYTLNLRFTPSAENRGI